MMKKKLIIVVAVIVVIAAAVFIYFDLAGRSIPMQLSELNHNGQYQYLDIPFGSAYSEVEPAFPSPLETDPLRVPAPEEYAFYVSKQPFSLAGYKADASVEFHHEGLETIAFSFKIGDGCKAWFDARIAELTELYGEPTDIKENEGGKAASLIYT